MKLLVIRPQPGADATAARVEAAGHEPLLMPLFAIGPVAWEAPEAADYDGLLITSANAVRHAGAQLKAFAQLPVLAVGEVTATAAAQAGLDVAYIGSSGVEALLNGVTNKKLLWLAGEDHTDFAKPASVRVDLRIVYRSSAITHPADFGGIVSQADYVLLHSARAAEHFALLLSTQGLEKVAISIAALSVNIVVAAGQGWKSVRIAPHPNDAALLSCL